MCIRDSTEGAELQIIILLEALLGSAECPVTNAECLRDPVEVDPDPRVPSSLKTLDQVCTQPKMSRAFLLPTKPQLHRFFSSAFHLKTRVSVALTGN